MIGIRCDLDVFVHDDCDQEVHQHDHAKELVKEPHDPNGVDHYLSLDASSEPVVFIEPMSILGSSYVTDWVSVYLDVCSLLYWHARIFTTIESTSNTHEQNGEDEDPKAKEHAEDQSFFDGYDRHDDKVSKFIIRLE